MTDLAKLVVRLEAQTAQYMSQIDRAEKRTDKFEAKVSKAFKGLATAAAAFQVASIVGRTIELGDNLDKAATKAGITGRAMSELAYVAKMSDIELTALSSAIKKMQVNLSEAATGGKAQIATLAALGLEFKDLKGLAADRQFEVIADRIRQLEDPLDRTRAATELFGKAGADLLPLFEQGAQGIRAAREEAQKMGASFSDEQIKKLAAADDAIKKLKSSWEGFAVSLVSKVAPAITMVLEKLTPDSGGPLDNLDLPTLEARLESMKNGFNEVEKAALRAEIAERRAYNAGSRGGRLGRAERSPQSSAAPGFEATAEGAKTKAAKEQWLDLQEVVVTAAKIHVDAMDQLYDSINERTRTTTEQALAEFAQLESDLQMLQERGGYDPAVIAERYAEGLDKLLPEVEVTAQKIGEKFEKETDKINAYQERLAANTVDLIADTIRGSFDGAIKDIPAKFAALLLDLAIQAQAARLGEMIFGATPGSGGGGSGFLGEIGSIIGGLFGPGRRKGGPVSPGTIYPVNEDTGKTEYFMPATAGTIIPHDQVGGGGMTVHNSFVIQAPNGSVSRQTQQQVAAAAARGIATANRRNN